MGRIAFYAPMKPPTHPTPSGDRQMARALMAALGDVELVSELRLYEGKGDAAMQSTLQQHAIAEAERLIATGKNWQAWVTYHNYYKAPDIIGPLVSRALDIPYIQIESTRSPKRLNGPWAQFAALSEAAADHADLIFYFTDRDQFALKQHKPANQILIKLHPFLALENLPPAAALTNKTILTVAMLRSGDKLASFEIIAKALPLLTTPDWQLKIAGDGPARDDIKALFAPFKAQVTLLGQLDQSGLNAAYHGAAIFLWPGINEAFGMVYLEAQAAGLPVVAQDRFGVRDVVHPDGLAAQNLGPKALAQSLDALLQSPEMRQSRGHTARAFIAENHLLNSARKTLLNGIRKTLIIRS
ncbi:glycosyltransferase family 4 protein [Profundibacter sp.]